jgi:hypothetical protein
LTPFFSRIPTISDNKDAGEAVKGLDSNISTFDLLTVSKVITGFPTMRSLLFKSRLAYFSYFMLSSRFIALAYKYPGGISEAVQDLM